MAKRGCAWQADGGYSEETAKGREVAAWEKRHGRSEGTGRLRSPYTRDGEGGGGTS